MVRKERAKAETPHMLKTSMHQKKSKPLDSSKTSGAAIEPRRPAEVQRPTAEFRTEVGKTSAVYTTVMMKYASAMNLTRGAHTVCNAVGAEPMSPKDSNPQKKAKPDNEEILPID
mmetsp:Transcript_68610/g.134782  ORF Transcript_68610/g.134782 Transcript_68610/m.134782 type:complete len:115 (+) Transcript_68610:231-575(+)